MQDARLHGTVGRDYSRTLWHHRCQAAVIPLRRPGEFAGADRTATRKQRGAHSHRDAGRHLVEECPCTRRAVAGVERGPWIAATMGPTMVTAHAAAPRLRDRPARLWRHFRRL